MQYSIKSHLNPITEKKAKHFGIKSRLSELSFFSKPNLSNTKVSNHFSKDQSQTQKYNSASRFKRQRCSLSTTIQDQSVLADRQSLKPTIFSARMPSRSQYQNRNDIINKKSNRSMAYQKSKLTEILQTVETNNKMIKQLFGYEEQISLIKDEIKKTAQMYQQVERQITEQSRPQNQSFDLSFMQRSKSLNKNEKQNEFARHSINLQKDMNLCKQIKKINTKTKKQTNFANDQTSTICQRCRCNTIR